MEGPWHLDGLILQDKWLMSFEVKYILCHILTLLYLRVLSPRMSL